MKIISIIPVSKGTGANHILGSFAAMGKNNVAIIDLSYSDNVLKEILHIGMPYQKYCYHICQADVDTLKCVRCHECIEVCSTKAISSNYLVDELLCNCCNKCIEVCEPGAISSFLFTYYVQQYYSRFNNYYIYPEYMVSNSVKFYECILDTLIELTISSMPQYAFIYYPYTVKDAQLIRPLLLLSNMTVLIADTSFESQAGIKYINRINSEKSAKTGLIVCKPDEGKKSKDGMPFDERYSFQKDIPYDYSFHLATLKNKSVIEVCEKNLADRIMGIWDTIQFLS